MYKILMRTTAGSSKSATLSSEFTNNGKRTHLEVEQKLDNEEPPRKRLPYCPHHSSSQQNAPTSGQVSHQYLTIQLRRLALSPYELVTKSERTQYPDPVVAYLADMSSTPPEWGYPKFANADVLIQSPTGKVWKLHKSMLDRASPVFAGLFASKGPLRITRKQGAEGVAIKWKMVMVNDVNAYAIDPNSLSFKTFKIMEKGAKFDLDSINNLNGLGNEQLFDTNYDNFFRCLYNLHPIFANDIENGGSRYTLQCCMLLQAAVYLNAVDIIRTSVEAHLLRLGQTLWHHISDKPEGWIHVGARLHSPMIFREALIHVVGKFHIQDGINVGYIRDESHGELGERIWKLILSKAKELKTKKLFVERQLLDFYPPSLVHPRTQDNVPGRAIYASDIYCWMALSLIRQYISSSYASNYHHRANDGGLSFYRTIGESLKYALGDTLHQFYATFDMSSKSRSIFQAECESIKNLLKPIVADLLIDRCQAVRTPTMGRWDHLTCCIILDEEMPWIAFPTPAWYPGLLYEEGVVEGIGHSETANSGTPVGNADTDGGGMVRGAEAQPDIEMAEGEEEDGVAIGAW